MPETEKSNSASLLAPSFEEGYWRSTERIAYTDHAGFSKKKKHFEPEGHSQFANRWAAELTREEHLAEVRQIYENSVVILGNKRSQMDRGDQSLDCTQFRYTIEAEQDPADHTSILVTRSLTVKVPLNSLPEHFDEIFPYKPTELVVPFTGNTDTRKMLEVFEEWESKLSGQIEESADQSLITLRLKSGFTMAVDLNSHEALFAKTSVEGVKGLAGAVAQDLKSMGITKKLE
ncbi:MAG: hypothetical protein ACXWQO_03490 [Bdellovibrionota bacterium]